MAKRPHADHLADLVLTALKRRIVARDGVLDGGDGCLRLGISASLGRRPIGVPFVIGAVSTVEDHLVDGDAISVAALGDYLGGASDLVFDGGCQLLGGLGRAGRLRILGDRVDQGVKLLVDLLRLFGKFLAPLHQNGVELGVLLVSRLLGLLHGSVRVYRHKAERRT